MEVARLAEEIDLKSTGLFGLGGSSPPASFGSSDRKSLDVFENCVGRKAAKWGLRILGRR